MTKKLLILSASLLFFPALLQAQAKVRELVTSDYNRNSISFVVTQRGDVYDADCLAAISSCRPGAKFDFNDLPTKSIYTPAVRAASSTGAQKYQLSASQVDAAVACVPFGRQILAYTFRRDASGMMTDELVRYRGSYDAKDQDVINARASRIGTEALGDTGQKLLANSYVIVADPYRIERATDKKGKVYYAASVIGYAFRMDITAELLDEFYAKCWIYEDDDEEVKREKLEAFKSFNVPMKLVSTVSATGTGDTPAPAVSRAAGSLIDELEKAISEWNVAVTISATRPLRAKIGTKEGISNGYRFRAYSYKEDRKGNIASVKRGFLRATEIAGNSSISTGATEPSKFYQISGMANIDEGWTIKQSKDAGFGVGISARGGGMSDSWGIGVNMDILTHTGVHGSMSHMLVDLSFDLGMVDYDCASMSFGIGYAHGFHFTRFFELAPYLTIGADTLMPPDSYSDSDDDTTAMAKYIMESALVFEPGVRATLNLAYPLQLYASAFYDLISLEGPIYQILNEDVGHRSGPGVQFGIKWTF